MAVQYETLMMVRLISRLFLFVYSVSEKTFSLNRKIKNVAKCDRKANRYAFLFQRFNFTLNYLLEVEYKLVLKLTLKEIPSGRTSIVSKDLPGTV